MRLPHTCNPNAPYVCHNKKLGRNIVISVNSEAENVFEIFCLKKNVHRSLSFTTQTAVSYLSLL